jgi:RHS repeat-associated protein
MGSLTSAVNLAHINGTTQAASYGHLQQIAKRGGRSGRFYLHGDHLGSTAVATSNTGAKTHDVRYFAYGAPRTGDLFALPTDHTFTGQKLDRDTGLMYYGARYYDPALGMFLSPDTLVPEPGNPQSLNRYSYVRNNPLRLVDPSGMAACAAGDDQCWVNEWNWKNRWYNAHGYFWGGEHWSVVGDPVFADEGITDEVIAEAGITLQSNVTPWPWSWANKQKVAYGVAKFGQKLARGIAGLKALLGGYAVINLNPAIPFYCTGACAPPPPWTGGHDVFFAIASFSAVDLLGGAQWVVHELAHVIDWQGNFSQRWEPYAALTNYAANARSVPPFYYSSWEKWAEAVAVWVFSDRTAGLSQYKQSEVAAWIKKNGIQAFIVQMDRMEALLQGWY